MHAGDEFIIGERLGQVIVRAAIKSCHTVFDLCTGSQHQDGSTHACCSHGLYDGGTIATGKHPIDYSYVIDPAQRELNAFISICGCIYLEALAFEHFLGQCCQSFVIFDQ